MADEACTKPTLRIGDADWEILPDSETAKFVDFILEDRVVNGVIALSVGSAIVDGRNPGCVQVAARLRMDLGVAQGLRDTLTNLIEHELNPPKLEKPN